MSLSISVALCTFNGAVHLKEQLDSLLHQWLPPNEVVIRDDCSSDGTFALLEDFARRATFEVRLYRNDVRLGYAANFAAAVRACRGEVIALCDQDDIWHPAKLTRLIRPFKRQPDLGLVFHDAAIVDDAGKDMGFGLWQYIGLNRLDRLKFGYRPLSVLLGHNLGFGNTMAFRRDLLSWAVRPPQGWSHDGWMALIGTVLFPCKLLPERLTFYRQHAGQIEPFRLCRRRSRTTPTDFSEVIHAYEAADERLATLPDRPVIREARRKIQALLRHYSLRAGLPDNVLLRFTYTLPHLLSSGYHRHARGLRSWAKDIVTGAL